MAKQKKGVIQYYLTLARHFMCTLQWDVTCRPKHEKARSVFCFIKENIYSKTSQKSLQIHSSQQLIQPYQLFCLCCYARTGPHFILLTWCLEKEEKLRAKWFSIQYRPKAIDFCQDIVIISPRLTISYLKFLRRKKMCWSLLPSFCITHRILEVPSTDVLLLPKLTLSQILHLQVDVIFCPGFLHRNLCIFTTEFKKT